MTDNKENLVCPACGKTMKKFFIDNANINIDLCVDGCGGIYFDNRELEKILKTDLKNEQDLYREINNKHFAATDSSEERICPVCGTPMMKNGAANGDIEIDICAFCGGKFLDASELQSIINSKSEENANNKIDAIIQTMQTKDLDNVVQDIKGMPGYKDRVNFFHNLAQYMINRG